MWTRVELKENALKFFKYNYWKMVLVAFVLSMVGGGGGFSFRYSTGESDPFGFNSMTSAEALTFSIVVLLGVMIGLVIGFALSAFLFNPIVVGVRRFFVVSHYQKADLNELGFGFSHNYLNVAKTMFLMQLYIFLWSLLFMIPGIIKGYEYRMIPYILAENPGIDSREAFAISKQMMDGNKWNAFVLDLSFLGWIILSAFTCGILAIFYVNPYIAMTSAELYVALKEITYGGGQNNYQNVYQQGNNQWNNGQLNNDQWNNNQTNNGQWNNNQTDHDQWNNGSQM